jgi:hypothetical protein
MEPEKKVRKPRTSSCLSEPTITRRPQPLTVIEAELVPPTDYIEGRRIESFWKDSFFIVGVANEHSARVQFL